MDLLQSIILIIFFVLNLLTGITLANLFSNQKIFVKKFYKIIFTVSMILLLILSTSMLAFSNNLNNENEVLRESADVQVIIEATIKPWSFNVTMYQTRHDPQFNEYFTRFRSLLNYEFRNTLENSYRYINYYFDEDYGRLGTKNFTVYTNQLVHIIIIEYIEDHRVTLTENGEMFPYYYKNEIKESLKSFMREDFYIITPSHPINLELRCTSFCGAGHSGQQTKILVVNPDSTP